MSSAWSSTTATTVTTHSTSTRRNTIHRKRRGGGGGEKGGGGTTRGERERRSVRGSVARLRFHYCSVLPSRIRGSEDGDGVSGLCERAEERFVPCRKEEVTNERDEEENKGRRKERIVLFEVECQRSCVAARVQ